MLFDYASLLVFSSLMSLAFTSASIYPATMQAVMTTGILKCDGPDWPCLTFTNTSTPELKDDEVIFEVKASSVDPYVIDEVQAPHLKSVIGGDSAGVVVQVGSAPECSHLTIGSEVWVQTKGAYAEFASAKCKATGLVPAKLSLIDAGTMPCVGVTSLQCLQATGAPWNNRTNVSVVITSGQGGTGFIGIQLAKALTASHVITAASGDGIAFVKSLGADVVIDFTKDDLFDVLPADSVDIVYDNYGAKGTADKAMNALRSGGVYLVMDTGEGGQISDHPKAGVTQIAFGLMDPSDRNTGLDILSEMFNRGEWVPHTQANYSLDQVKDAFNQDTSGKVLGKLAVLAQPQ